MSQLDIKVITKNMINMQVGQTKDAMQGMVNKVNDLMKGAKASLDKANLPKKNGSTFFLQTIDKYKHQISEMEKMFKRYLRRLFLLMHLMVILILKTTISIFIK